MIAAQKDIMQFFKNADNAQKLNDLVEDIREAMIDYQVRTSKCLVLITPNIHIRLPYNRVSTTTLVK